MAAGLGPYLSHLRQERGLSIEEMARATRVAFRYLEALEREDFAALPAPVFTKGYIRAYCQVLEVPVDEALARYATSAEVAIARPVTAVASPAARRSDDRRARGTLLLSFVLLVGFGIALFVVALLLQSGRPEVGARRAESPTRRVAPEPRADAARPSQTAAPSPNTTPAPEVPSAGAAPSVSASLEPSAAARATAIQAPAPAPLPASRPRDAKPAPAAERPAADAPRTAAVVVDAPPLRLGSVASPYRLVARTLEPTWLRVRTEDGRATEETIPAGEVREWISNRPFVVTIGNAAGIALELNGHKLPPLGGRGVVISRLILPPAEP